MSTSAIPARGPLTTDIIGTLNLPGFPVGDDTEPEASYGWQEEPDGTTSQFIPWMVLSPGQGQPQRLQSFQGSQEDWNFFYNVFYAGISRKQCEALADRMRQALISMTKNTLNTETGKWKIQNVSCTGVGSVNRAVQTMPYYYTQNDTFSFMITKGL